MFEAIIVWICVCLAIILLVIDITSELLIRFLQDRAMKKERP